MEKEYTSDDIQALSAARHVQLRPKLYFESCFKDGNLNQIPFEVLCHAFDNYFDQQCDTIKLSFWKNSFTVHYNAGISLKNIHDDLTVAEAIMTKVGTCSNLKNHLHVGAEFCELGMATINFAAMRCELTTRSAKGKGHFIFEMGETTSKQIEPYSGTDFETTISMQLNTNLFGDLEFTLSGLTEKAKAIEKRLPGLVFSVEERKMRV